MCHQGAATATVVGKDDRGVAVPLQLAPDHRAIDQTQP